MLTSEQLRSYDTDGFVVVPQFKSADELVALRRRAEEIVVAYDQQKPASIFMTGGDSERSDAYFLESGEAIRCFFEPDGKTINKIGHAMHDLDPVFETFSRDPRLTEIAHRIGLRDPLVYQSMYIFKQPRVGGEINWHQDGAFFETDPPSVVTFWFALEHADRNNGCLWVQPGGHRTPLRHRFVASDGTAKLCEIDTTPWPTLEQSIPVEVEAGALLVFSGMLPHYSAQNTSDHSRHAYTLHAVDANASYSPLNWLQRKKLPLRGFS